MSKRTTVTLTESDVEALAAVADPARPESAALRAMADELGVEIRDNSESALVRALLAAGAAAVQQRALERGYRELAAIYPEVHDAPEAAERRRRYARRVDAHMDG
jgi:predicted secreted protein